VRTEAVYRRRQSVGDVDWDKIRERRWKVARCELRGSAKQNQGKECRS